MSASEIIILGCLIVSVTASGISVWFAARVGGRQSSSRVDDVEQVGMTLTEFLLARIAEDERCAQAYAPALPTVSEYRMPTWSLPPNGLFTAERMLAECHSKRYMVAMYVALGSPVRLSDRLVAPTVRVVLETIMREMASVYDKHPDYRDDLVVHVNAAH